MSNDIQQQVKNRDDAIKAAKDFIDYFFEATPEFKSQIRDEVVMLIIAKSKSNHEANEFLNSIIEFRSVLNAMGIIR